MRFVYPNIRAFEWSPRPPAGVCASPGWTVLGRDFDRSIQWAAPDVWARLYRWLPGYIWLGLAGRFDYPVGEGAYFGWLVESWGGTWGIGYVPQRRADNGRPRLQISRYYLCRWRIPLPRFFGWDRIGDSVWPVCVDEIGRDGRRRQGFLRLFWWRVRVVRWVTRPLGWGAARWALHRCVNRILGVPAPWDSIPDPWRRS